MNEYKDKNFQTIIDNRETLRLNGVINIEGFGEEYLILNTSLGELTIEGENLKIESLIKESGEILIVGKFNGMFYKEKNFEKRLFRKIFK